ncbi:MAG TPA: hypothetical protein VEX69_00820 [Candidatus Limnocylindria bacterium]|nr:hypothetical protein [Candidatus Limnocylindria bacterium]
MSLAEILFFLIPLMILGVIWILCRPLTEETSLDRGGTIEDLLPFHSQHFPQLRGALDFTDARYISRRVSKDGEGSWSAERKQIVRDYLTGLAGDFARVSSLARIVDSLSLRASKRTRLERIWLMLRFRILYRTILLSLWRERCSKLHQVGRLTGYVGSLSALGETAMSRLELMSSDDEVQSDISV